MSEVRVRIAPSPTGEPHIGTAYVALVNESFARRHGGKFIVRIEDTDQVRSTREAEEKIFESLSWMGFTWDEGPDVGGPYGPYRQTERRAIYHTHVNDLLEKGHAFKCFCTPERLDIMRSLQRKKGLSPKYDGHCLNLTADEIKAKEQAGEKAVVRMKIPTEGECTFTDGVYGEVSIPWVDVDMQVIMKSDGLPTYHLACVVDDHLMKITHVIRGEEWISSTPKHIKLYDYFGWKSPDFMHLPVLRNMDRTKLSKRKNHTSISWFERQGYVPEAMVNFLGHFFVRVAEGEEELMSKAEFVDRFDLSGVSRAGAVFDLAKLDWFNGRWVREKFSDAQFLTRTVEWATKRGTLEAGLKLAKSRITKLSDLPDLAGFLLGGSLNVAKESFTDTKLTDQQLAAVLFYTAKLADEIKEWNAAALWDGIKALEAPLGLKARQITAPLFIAITGQAKSLPLTESMEILGRALCRDRLRRARDLFDWQPLLEAEKRKEVSEGEE